MDSHEENIQEIRERLNQMARMMRSFDKGEVMVILVDSGNTHNFLDPSIMSKYQLSMGHASKVDVKITNG